jgi:hypothetical protein
MSEQAEKLLAQWENQHIEVVPRSDRKDQAQRLALRCREDAAKGGISSKDLVDIHANADAGPRQSGHDQPPFSALSIIHRGSGSLSELNSNQASPACAGLRASPAVGPCAWAAKPIGLT